MTPQSLQSVKKKIYAVCQEKMELSFGCEVATVANYISENEAIDLDKKATDFSKWRKGIITRKQEPSINESWVVEFGDGVGIFFRRELIVIGHPLDLPEVLRAIGKKIDFQIFQFDIQNNEMYLWDTGKDEETGFRWNLLVNLDGQSEEVWKFLDEIL